MTCICQVKIPVATDFVLLFIPRNLLYKDFYICQGLKIEMWLNKRFGQFIFVCTNILVVINSASTAKKDGNVVDDKISRPIKEKKSLENGNFWEFVKGRLKLTARINVGVPKEGMGIKILNHYSTSDY